MFVNILHIWLLPRHRRLLTLLRLWCQRSRQRRHLLRLDADRLDDIGLSRRDAEREAAKWFWEP